MMQYVRAAVIAAGVALVCANTVTAGPDRTTQLYVPRGLYSTAQFVNWMRPAFNNSLFNVNMFFDFSFESFSYNRGKLKTWNPPVAFWWQTDYWKYYIDPSSCLGPTGPLGYKGPLGGYGPIGNNSWDPVIDPFDPTSWSAAYWLWFRSIAGWAFNSNVSLGEDGPLGKSGPLVESQIYNQMYHLNSLFQANDFPINLDITGVWGVLGPLSIMGPLGMLGALGPLGPHLYTSAGDGQYRTKAGEIVRTLTTQFDKSKNINRIYDLFEVYPVQTAVSLGAKNDASFAVDGTIMGSSDVKQRFRFTSSRSQSITAAALANGDKFIDLDLVVYRVPSKGSPIEIIRSVTASTYSPASGLVDWAIWYANAGDVYEVQVLTSSATSGRYRLMVLGTGFKQGAPGQEVDVDLFNHNNIVGPHQDNFCTRTPKAC